MALVVRGNRVASNGVGLAVPLTCESSTAARPGSWLGRRLLTIAWPGFALACGDAGEPLRYDVDETIARAVAYEALERLDGEAVETIHSLSGGLASLHADEQSAAIFRSIDIDDPEATAEFPRGSIFVKRNFDAEGNPVGLINIMAKFEAGYNPRGNDWFFAAIDEQGEVLEGLAGNGEAVEFCRDCHSTMGGATDLIIALEADQLR